MENRMLVGGSVVVSLVGLSTLCFLSFYFTPHVVTSSYEDYIDRYVILRGVVTDTSEKFFIVNEVEVFYFGGVNVGDYAIVEGVLKRTPEKYVRRGFPPVQISPEKCAIYPLNESFFCCRVESERVRTRFGNFTFENTFNFNGIGGIIGEIMSESIIIDEIFPLHCDTIQGKIRKSEEKIFIGDTELLMSGSAPAFGEQVRAYGFLQKKFFCLYYECEGVTIDKIEDLTFSEVSTVQGVVTARRYYYDGHLLELTDGTGTVKAYVKERAYEEYTVEVSGFYNLFRSEPMLVGEIRVISDEIALHDLTSSIPPSGTFWGRGLVERVENVRGHLYLYIGEQKISVYAADARELRDHGIDLYQCEGREMTVFLQHDTDLVLLDVME
jgi:hypothetical protein